MDMFKNKCTLLPVFGTFKQPFFFLIIGIQNCPYDNCVQRKTIYLKKMLKLKKKIKVRSQTGAEYLMFKVRPFFGILICPRVKDTKLSLRHSNCCIWRIITKFGQHVGNDNRILKKSTFMD